jgi:hypothetical protein
MTKLEKGKFNFQLPKRLENHLPQEIIPHILAPFKVDTSDSNSVNGWLIEHFYSENPLSKGNTILLYNRDFDSFEINIEDIDDNNLEIRRITKLTKDKLNNPQRIPMDNLTMLIDRENVSIQFSDQTPNDLQP